MKNSNLVLNQDKQNKTKKSSLDNFQLFYEEVPLQLKKPEVVPSGRSTSRLVRKSRVR